jgi:hypothetical protein
MKAVVISPKSADEFKFIHSLLKKLGIKSTTLTKEEIEDAGLLKLMKSADRTKKASREVILKKLGSK